MTSKVCVAAGAIAIMACRESSRRPDSSGQQNAAMKQTVDSTAVVLRGPTLVAFSPSATEAQIDSSEALATILDDYSFHLSQAADSLRALGVAVNERTTGPVVVIDASGDKRLLVPRPDLARIAYAFVAPHARDTIYYGVMASSDLVAAAHALLRKKP